MSTHMTIQEILEAVDDIVATNQRLGTDYGNIKNYTRIDRNKLEDECQIQSDLFSDVGEKTSVAKKNARYAKLIQDVAASTIGMDIRINSKNYDVDKITVDIVNNAIQINDTVLKAQNACIDAQRMADLFGTLLDAMAHRKSSLRELVSLWVHSYYELKQDMVREANIVGGRCTEAEIVALRQQRAAQQQEDSDDMESPPEVVE